MHCPCCSGKLLSHISPQGLYWYCPACRQAMPVLSEILARQSPREDPPGPTRQLWIYIPLHPKWLKQTA